MEDTVANSRHTIQGFSQQGEPHFLGSFMFKSLRTKLVVAFVLTIILPLIPLTFVVKKLIDQSIELGVNERMEQAFESAVDVAQENLTIRQNTVIAQAQVISNLFDIRQPFLARNYLQLHISVDIWSRRLNVQAVQIFDINNLEDSLTELVSGEVASNPHVSTHLNEVFPAQARVQLMQYLEYRSQNEDYLLELPAGSNVVKAWSPIRDGQGKIAGIVVVTQVNDPVYQAASEDVMEAMRTYQKLGVNVTPLSMNYLLTFVVVASIMILISLVASVVITNSIMRPILNLVAGTRELAAGNLDHRVETTSDDELRQLVDAFNAMAENLKENRKRLLQSERITAWQDVARKLAHEIKNPLTPIQLSIQHLRDQFYKNDPAYPQILEECTETISEEVDTLRKMVNTFSEFAQLPRSDPHPEDLNKVIESVVSLYRENHTDLEIITQYAELPPLLIDAEQFKRVTHNLIRNALEAMKHRGTLTIQTRIHPETDHVEIRFIDTGSGIPEHVRPHLFKPYFTTKTNGTGLGLAIVSRIVQDHFGEISIENNPNGIGATTIIRLPLHM
ncbi:MAG: HAMP domain-containing protein [Gemmatimonadetes bacterium]|nr:MAG: HAMP domain-containing protein [Gemmatimonadota bacterium]